MRQKAVRNALVVAGVGISSSGALAWVIGNDSKSRACFDSGPRRTILATSASLQQEEKPLRTYNTAADKFYKKQGCLPFPSTPHAVLPELDYSNSAANQGNGNNHKNILVIGDVHGCYDELLLLHEKAVQENDNTPFRYVVLVGDLCNKGPKSVRVIQHVRKEPHWFAVRGNHDNAALKAALGDERRRQGKKYQWVAPKEEEEMLTDQDVLWLSELPYTIRIPGGMLNDSMDTVVVHAGLVPNVDLEEQTVETMVTLREVQKNRSSGRYIYARKAEEKEQFDAPKAWAAVWNNHDNSPFRVVFGHDARRGLQRYDGDWAIGLDTGACYGKKLTGLILPQRTLVSVDSLEAHCPIE